MTIFQQNKKINPQKILRILRKFWGLPSFNKKVNPQKIWRILRKFWEWPTFKKQNVNPQKFWGSSENSEDKQCSTKKVNPQKILRINNFRKNAILRHLWRSRILRKFWGCAPFINDTILTHVWGPSENIAYLQNILGIGNSENNET